MRLSTFKGLAKQLQADTLIKQVRKAVTPTKLTLLFSGTCACLRRLGDSFKLVTTPLSSPTRTMGHLGLNTTFVSFAFFTTCLWKATETARVSQTLQQKDRQAHKARPKYTYACSLKHTGVTQAFGTHLL